MTQEPHFHLHILVGIYSNLSCFQAVLGPDTSDERHVVDVESVTFKGEKIRQPLLTLQKGKSEMVKTTIRKKTTL